MPMTLPTAASADWGPRASADDEAVHLFDLWPVKMKHIIQIKIVYV